MRSARRTSSSATRTGCATRPAAATPTWRACATGALEGAPDAVLMPADAEALRRAIDACAAEGVAIVPFGGGTSVVGGVEPLRGAHGRLVSLDLGALREVSVDRRSLTATLGAGLRGPEAEAALGAQGLTLGHFPQSFEYATVGGFAATRSAGQASSGYGRFDALVSSVRLLAPAGEISDPGDAAHRRRPRPARAGDRLRGRARRDPRRHRAGAPGADRAPLRGLDRRELRRRGGDRPHPRPGAGPARRSSASPTRRRPRGRWR